jgi:hypothetical protein
MLTNFLFEGGVGIRFEGKHFDLHSFFSIAGVTLSPKAGTVLLQFDSIREFRDRTHGVEQLWLEFSEVSYLEFSPRFCTNVSDSLEEFGFKAPDDRNDEWLKDVERAEPGDHLFVRLSSLEFLRIHCAAVRVQVVPTPCNRVLSRAKEAEIPQK